MKKVSTVTAAQSRNISQQKLTVGLDLGDRNCWYCVVDEAGQIQLEQRVRTNANVKPCILIWRSPLDDTLVMKLSVVTKLFASRLELCRVRTETRESICFVLA